MPAITRKGDLCTGHPPYAPRAAIQGEASFTVAGKEVHLAGHSWAPHPHPGKLASGATGFTVKGKAVGRVGDPIDCGSKVATGEGSFTVGG